MKSSWGQGEQERSLAALEAAGFQGAGTPLRLAAAYDRMLGRWGLGSAEGSPLVQGLARMPTLCHCHGGCNGGAA